MAKQDADSCDARAVTREDQHIRGILVQEQDHQIALANALGVEIPNVTRRGE